MMKINVSGGTVIIILIAVVILLIAALRWLGQNAAAIGRGIGAGLEVLAVLAVLAGAWALARRAHAARHPAPGDPPAPPVHVASEQVPAALEDAEPLALPPAGAHYHFGDMDPETAVAVARALRGDDRDA